MEREEEESKYQCLDTGTSQPWPQFQTPPDASFLDSALFPFYPPSSFSCSLFLTLVLAIPSDVPSQVTQTRLTTPSSISAWHTYYLALSRNMCQLAHTGAAECKSPLTSVLLLVVHEALYTKRNSALCFGTADEETECCDTQLCNPVK